MNGNIITSNESGASYQWLDCNDNNSAIQGETNQDYTVTQNGSFSVRIDNGNCIDTSNCVTISNASLDENKKQDFQIFPNPTNDKINLSFAIAQQNITVKILNTLGQMIHQETFEAMKSKSFNLPDRNGIYFIQIESKWIHSQTIRVLKQ